MGLQAVALIVQLNKQFGLLHAKIAALLRDWFGLAVQPSGITNALHRAARQAAPTYDALRRRCAAVRSSVPMKRAGSTGRTGSGEQS